MNTLETCVVHLFRRVGWRQLATVQTCGTTAEIRQWINWVLSLPSARGNVKSRRVRKRLSSTLQAFLANVSPNQLIARVGSVRGKMASAESFSVGPFLGISQHLPICQLSSLTERCLMFPVRVPASQLTAAGDNGKPRCNGGVKPKQQKKRQVYTQRSTFIHGMVLPLEGLQRGETQIQQT